MASSSLEDVFDERGRSYEPFANDVRHREIIENGLGLEDEGFPWLSRGLFDAIVDCSNRIYGVRRVFVGEFRVVGRNPRDNRLGRYIQRAKSLSRHEVGSNLENRERRFVPVANYDEFEGAALSYLPPVIWSPEGRWGLVFDWGPYALLGGSDDLLACVERSLPSPFAAQRTRVLGVLCKYSIAGRQPRYMRRELEKMLVHLYGSERGTELLTDALMQAQVSHRERPDHR